MTKANVVLAAATVLFASGCFLLLRDLNIERNRVHALEAQVAGLQRDAKTPEPAPSDSGTPTSEQPAQPATVKPVAAARTTEGDEWRRVLADPAYRKAMLADHRRATAGIPSNSVLSVRCSIGSSSAHAQT